MLDQTDLFGQMPPDLLSELSGRTELSKYRRNELICEQGGHAERLFIVFSGRVAITVKATDGRESVVAVLGPGALFGELPLFDGGTRSSMEVQDDRKPARGRGARRQIDAVLAAHAVREGRPHAPATLNLRAQGVGGAPGGAGGHQHVQEAFDPVA